MFKDWSYIDENRVTIEDLSRVPILIEERAKSYRTTICNMVAAESAKRRMVPVLIAL